MKYPDIPRITPNTKEQIGIYLFQSFRKELAMSLIHSLPTPTNAEIVMIENSNIIFSLLDTHIFTMTE
jgi:hypothetical protein